MRFFKTMDEERVNVIKALQKKEAKFASVMRIILTVVLFVGWGVTWVVRGNYDNPLLYVVGLVVFYWVWFQFIPWIGAEREWGKQLRELRFVTLLYKYIDAKALEEALENLSERVSELEERAKH